MSIWERVWNGIRGAAAQIKAAAYPIFPRFMRYSFMDGASFRTAVNEGYKKNSAVFACVQALAFGFSEPRLAFYRDEQQRDDHPLGQLLRNPNPDLSLKSILQMTMVYAAIGGNCYWLKTRDRAGNVVEIWPLHDGQMIPVPGGSRLISRYELYDGDGMVVADVPPEDVIQFRWAVDPLQPWRGMSALTPCAREVDLDSEMTAYEFALLKNNAVPPLALVVPPGELLQPFQIERMRKQWVDQYGGDSRGKPAVLEGGVDVKQLSFDVNRLAADAMRSIPESRITAAFRVPAIIAGLQVGLEHATYSNYREAGRHFTEGTLVSLWDRHDDVLTAGFRDDFDLRPGDEVRYLTETVAAMRDRVLEMGEFVDRGIAGGYMMINEGRDFLMLPPVANGNIFLRPMMLSQEPGAIESQKARVDALERKARDANRRAALALGRTLQSIRKEREGRMAADVERFFRDLAATVVERARDLTEAGLRSNVLEWRRAGWRPGQMQPGQCERVALKQPSESDLIQPDDWSGLEEVFGFWSYNIVEASWETWNTALNVGVGFNRNDPVAVAIVRTLGERITQISDATRNGVREVLAEGYDRGWSIDHIVAGDDLEGVPGLAETVGGLTYRGPNGNLITLTPEQRARMVARTELGTAQNMASMMRYEAAGVDRVLVLDDGFENSHPFCVAINGKVVSREWADAHPLCHPNCVRAYAPEFDQPIDEGAVAAAERAGACPF